MSKRLTQIRFLPFVIAALMSLSLAQGALADGSSVATVTVAGNAVHIAPHLNGQYQLAIVRIASPDGRFMVNRRTSDALVSWQPTIYDADGTYRYEIILIPYVEMGTSRKQREHLKRTPNMKLSGTLELQQGELRDTRKDNNLLAPQSSNRSANFQTQLMLAANTILEFILPAAEAGDVIAYDFGIPAFLLDDYDNGISVDYGLQANWDNGSVILADYYWGHNLISISSMGNSNWSIFGVSNGDLSFADDSVYIDKSNDFVGIGTTIPTDSLHIVNPIPSVVLEDTLFGGTVGMGNFDGNLILANDPNNDGNFNYPFAITGDATDFSLTVTPGTRGDGASAGFIGIGTTSPSRQLTIVGYDSQKTGKNTTGITVFNGSNQNSPRTMLELSNFGDPKMVYKNRSNGILWQVNPSGQNFIYSKSGSGKTELTIYGNGNLGIPGIVIENSDRDTKQNISPIEPQKILRKVVDLPISEWQYKAEEGGIRHIGPMAQDFFAAFSLGASERTISSLDTAGVALAAIQALSQKVEQQAAELAQRDLLINEMNTRLEGAEALLLDLQMANKDQFDVDRSVANTRK